MGNELLMNMAAQVNSGEEVTWDDVRNALSRVAAEQKEWAGAPMPIRGLKLAVEPHYPFASLNGATLDEVSEDESDRWLSGFTLRNQWHTYQRNAVVHVLEGPDGKSHAELLPCGLPSCRLTMELKTLGAYDAWSLDAEMRAIAKLRATVTENAFQQYVCCGLFVETSKRSNVTYVFRRLRPTVALGWGSGSLKILASLCLHPIAYYQDSFAGCMVPTDDVLAHLLLMRADEVRLWRKANQHQPWEDEAGI